MSVPVSLLPLFQLAGVLWENAAEFEGWHGFGIGGEVGAEYVAFFVEPGADAGNLEIRLRHWRDRGEARIVLLARFQSGETNIALTERTVSTGAGISAVWNECSKKPGTLGGFVRQERSASTWLMSNCHVLARNRGCLTEGRVCYRGTVVSRNIRRVPFLERGNLADVAVALLDQDTLMDTGGSLLTSGEPVDVPRQSIVSKNGNATGTTSGILLYDTCTLQIFLHDTDYGITDFQDQMIIGPRATAPFFGDGDSGSIVVYQGRPAALLVGESPVGGGQLFPHAAASPMRNVLAELGRALGRTWHVVVP